RPCRKSRSPCLAGCRRSCLYRLPDRSVSGVGGPPHPTAVELSQRGISMRTALVCGAGGFIGGHLVKRLKSEGFWVRGVDLKSHEYYELPCDDFAVGDLRDPYFGRSVI